MTPHFSLQRFARDQLPVTPWKNGGGSTREIACWPPGAGLSDFGWRISIATIAAPGPFSVFAGIDRNIMLLDGDGMRLESTGSIDHRLDTPGQPFAFSGDLPINCTLLGGESSDFNVMARRGQWQADVQVLEEASDIAPAPHGLLLVLSGTWRVSYEQEHDHEQPALHAGDGLRWSGEAPSLHAQPDSPGARLAAVRLHAPIKPRATPELS